MLKKNLRSLPICRSFSIILATIGIVLVSLNFQLPSIAPCSFVEQSSSTSSKATPPTAADANRTSKNDNPPTPTRGGEPCLSVLDTIRQTQDCFFHNQTNCPSSSGPMYNYAYYAGQGFGRLIEHSTGTCLTAAALSRPCIIDINPRDEHYTWRSFMDLNPKYAAEASELWDGDAQAELETALSRLESKAAGHWSKNITHPIENQYTNVLPMVKDDDTPMNDQLLLWDGSNQINGKKVLLSPNWGTAWFTRASTVIPGVSGGGSPKSGEEELCDRDRLTTLLQNEIYRLGPLAKRLHWNHWRRIFNDTDTTSYGAVHLRTFFYLQNSNVKLDDLIEDLDTCLASIPNVQSWWLLIDKPSLSQNVTSALNNNPHNPRRIRYGYDDVTEHPHSNGDDATAEMGHMAMAPSILDWAAIHEADVAVVGEGAYGNTAARGRGKVPRLENKTACRRFNVWERR